MLILLFIFVLTNEIYCEVRKGNVSKEKRNVLSLLSNDVINVTGHWEPPNFDHSYVDPEYRLHFQHRLSVTIDVLDANLFENFGRVVSFELKFNDSTWDGDVLNETAMAESVLSLRIIVFPEGDDGFKLESVLYSWLNWSLTGFTNCQIVDIGHNPIKNINIMRPLPTSNSTKHLYLKNCELWRITDEFMNVFPYLEVLFVIKNPDLRNIDGLEKMTSLKYLDISDTHFGQNFLESFDLKKYPKNLEYLAIKRNEIFGPLKLSISLRNLRKLFLDGNELTDLNSSLDFAPGSYISFQKNRIDNIDRLKVNNVSYLDLSRNQISIIDDNFNIFGNVMHLDLSNNLIVNWTSLSNFQSENHLINAMNLSYNSMITMTKDMRDSVANLSVLDLGKNPFYCSSSDCELPLFQSWLMNKSSMIYNGGSKRPPGCKYPPLNKVLPITDMVINEELCTIRLNYAAIIGLPVFGLIILSVATALYVNRFQVFYIAHMLRSRKRANRKKINKSGDVENIQYDYDVFVSYSSQDSEWVTDSLIKNLEDGNENYTLCLHERDFRLGAYILDNITESMQRSCHVLLVLSTNFVKSQWCQWEMKLVQQLMFEDNSDLLLLVELERLNRDDVPSSLRLLMNTQTYLEWPNAHELRHRFWSRLKLALGPPLSPARARSESTTLELSADDDDNRNSAEFREEIRQCYLANIREALEDGEFELPEMRERL